MGQISLFCIFFIFKLGSNIAFLHSNSYFAINIGPNISFFLHSKSYFQFQNWAEYCFFFTFFDIWIGNKYSFFHLESYFDIQLDIQNWSIYRLLYIQKSILTFETGPNITFLHFWYCYLAKYRFYTVSDILLRTKYRIFTIQIQDCAEYHFFLKIQNPILTFKMGWILFFNNFFDILIGINCRLFSFEIIFWHSKWVFFSFFFYMQNSILTFSIGPNITFLHFLLSNWDQISLFTFKFLFWHSILG